MEGKSKLVLAVHRLRSSKFNKKAKVVKAQTIGYPTFTEKKKSLDTAQNCDFNTDQDVKKTTKNA